MDNNMEVEKIFKNKKNILIIGLVILAIAIGLIVAGVITNKNKYDNEEVHVYNDLIAAKKDKEEMLVELEITEIPYLFATKEEKSTKQNFYFAIDKNNYWYIVRLTEDTYKKIEEQYNADKENFKYTLKGYIYDDPSELKRLAISAYNENLSETAEKLTTTNFRDYLGITYLDETKTPFDSTATTFIGIGIGTGVISLIFFIIYFSKAAKIKSALKKYNIEDLKDELNNCDMSQYAKQTIYLTNKYLISTLNGLDVFEYKDIVWVYNEKRKQNGVSLGVWLIVCTMDRKRIQVARAQKDDILIEIMTKIKEKNQDILVGFTGDNNKQYKEITKK